mgnify:CR=1 FL=1
MTTETFIGIMNSGEKILCGSDVHRYMGKLSQEAMKITAMINCGYHEPKEIRELFSLLTGREVNESFRMFPPFYTDCGKNIHIGRNVFLNGGCRFQDQGGIYIDDGALIGPMVVLATLNHEQNPEYRGGSFSKTYSYREKCLDWSKCHSIAGSYHWGWGNHSCRSSGCERCSARCNRGRCACKNNQKGGSGQPGERKNLVIV